MTRTSRLAIAAAVTAAVSATSVSAQSEARPPSGAVFGGAADNSTKRTLLNGTINLATAFDQDVVTNVAGQSQSVFQGNGFYATLTPSLSFESRGNRLRIGVNVGSDVRYYQEFHEVMTMANSVALGLNAQLTPRTSISVSPGFTYSPALYSGLFSAGPASTLGSSELPSDSNYLLSSNPSYGYALDAGLVHKMSSRASVTVSSAYRLSDFTGNVPGYVDVMSAEAGGRFVYNLNRGLQTRLGYVVRRGQYAGAPFSLENTLDIGIGYSHALSRTRRTTFSFSLGPTSASGASLPSTEVRRQFRVVGDASLMHQFGRTWGLQGFYHRGVGYIQGFSSPVFSTSYSASAGGFINRRMDLRFSGAYSAGEPALNGAVAPFNTYTGDARLRIGLSRTMATYLQYVFYDYEISPTLPRPPGVPPAMTRNGVRFGLTMWIPVRNR